MSQRLPMLPDHLPPLGPPRPSMPSDTGLTLGSGGSSPDRRKRAWLLLPLTPAIVVVLGLAVAVAIGIFGVSQLSRRIDEHTAIRARLLAATVAARLPQLEKGDRLEMLRLAGRRGGAEFLVVNAAADVFEDTTLATPDRAMVKRFVAQKDGRMKMPLGDFQFAVEPLGPTPATKYLIAFVRHPGAGDATPALLRALLAMTTLLVGVAAAVAYAVARDANKDVAFVAERVRGMVRVRSEPTGEMIPVRTMDEVGALTSAFNQLVSRFAAAEKKSRENLDRVRAADRDRAAFLAAISHELRSPLNAVLGFADILMTEVDGPLSPGAREEVEQIRGSGQHLLELINDILEFSALESGQLRLSYTQVDLFVLASEIVREAAGVVGTRPLALRVEGEANVIAHADLRRTRQILTNLVGNAVKFTPQGEVVITVGTEGRYARVAVRDTGPGISPAERAVIFEEYRQTKEERRKRRGTGLGLAIALRLALMQGGTIQVDSEIGKGSVFKVLLPRFTSEHASRRRRSTPPPSRPGEIPEPPRSSRKYLP